MPRAATDDEWRELLATRFVGFADTECGALPLYDRISRAASNDPEVIDLLLAAPPGQRRPVLLLAALHDLVVGQPDVPAARWFPSVTGRPVPEGDPWPDVRSAVLDDATRMKQVCATRSTQTNEPNRSALWALAVPWIAAEVDGPLAMVELGCSAGLNLRWERMSLQLDGLTVRDLRGTAVASTRSRPGQPPVETLPEIVARVGIDRSPVDLTDPAARRWLRACIWAEQTDRLDRFDESVAAFLADPAPPSLVQGDAMDELAEVVESLPSDAHLVVYWSWFLTYVERSRREALDVMLDLIGQRRSLSVISAEASGVSPRFVDPGRPGDLERETRTVVGVSRWRLGHRRDAVVARCHPHLQWIDWLG